MPLRWATALMSVLLVRFSHKVAQLGVEGEQLEDPGAARGSRCPGTRGIRAGAGRVLLRTSRWASTADSEDATRNGSTPRSMSLATAAEASLV